MALTLALEEQELGWAVTFEILSPQPHLRRSRPSGSRPYSGRRGEQIPGVSDLFPHPVSQHRLGSCVPLLPWATQHMLRPHFVWMRARSSLPSSPSSSEADGAPEALRIPPDLRRPGWQLGVGMPVPARAPPPQLWFGEGSRSSGLWAIPWPPPCRDCCSLPAAGGPSPQHHGCPGFPSPWPRPPSLHPHEPFPKPHPPVLLSCECPPVLVTGEQCW